MRPRFLLISLALSLSCTAPPSSGAIGKGTVEVHEADLGPPVSATLLRILVDEGDQVRLGDTLAILLLRDLDATIALRTAQLRTARATLRDLEAGARAPERRRAEADLIAAEAEVKRAGAERVRMVELTRGGHATEQALDDAIARHDAAVARRDAAKESLQLVEAGTRPDQIAAARAAVASADATRRTAQARASDLVLIAPFDGQILARYAEPGEVLAAGMPALAVGQIDQPWVRVYLPARIIEQLRLGDTATIQLDGPPIPARVTAIIPRAEFTPRVALTEEERSDLLFGVKVEPLTPDPSLRPGLWATVTLPGHTAP